MDSCSQRKTDRRTTDAQAKRFGYNDLVIDVCLMFSQKPLILPYPLSLNQSPLNGKYSSLLMFWSAFPCYRIMRSFGQAKGQPSATEEAENSHLVGSKHTRQSSLLLSQYKYGWFIISVLVLLLQQFPVATSFQSRTRKHPSTAFPMETTQHRIRPSFANHWQPKPTYSWPSTSWSLRASEDSNESSEILDASLDPSSPEAINLLQKLALSDRQCQQLQQLALEIVEWNGKINLISRVNCNPSTVFAKHIVPSLGLVVLQQTKQMDLTSVHRICDVGTGGGFPGLPLAIAFPDVDFVLLDSVGKKLKVIQEIADTLELDNVQTHHGRAEEYMLGLGTDNGGKDKTQRQRFELVTGRSVAAIPQFCCYMQDLLLPDGKLVYWIGGDIDQSVQSHIENDYSLQNDLFGSLSSDGKPLIESDKHLLTFSKDAVTTIARESGIRLSINKPSKKKSQGSKPKRKTEKARGAWSRRQRHGSEDAEPKQRGYENFQRYSS